MTPDLVALIDRIAAADRAIYAAAGLLPVRCEWCGDCLEFDDKRLRRNRFNHPFCSEYCRRAWRRVEGA